MESVLKHFVHLRSTADPKLLTSGREALVQELLVPTRLSGLSVGQTEVKLEVFRLHLLQKLQKSQPARLSSVEVGDVEGELEVIGDFAGFFLVHFSHNEASHVCTQVHEGDGAGTSSESDMLTELLHTE